MRPEYSTNLLVNIEIVSQSNTVTPLNFENLVFTVTVESGPFDSICLFAAPVVNVLVAFMSNA